MPSSFINTDGKSQLYLVFSKSKLGYYIKKDLSSSGRTDLGHSRSIMHQYTIFDLNLTIIIFYFLLLYFTLTRKKPVWFSVRFYFLVILCVSACSNTSLLCEAVQFLLKTLMSMHFESVTARLCFSLKRLWRPKGRLETCSTGYEIESDLTLLSKSLGLTLVQWVQHTFSTQRTSFLSIKVREPLSKIPV